MNKHTTAPIGKRINVILHDNTRFIDKLISINSKYYEFEERGRVQRITIRSFAIARPRDEKTKTI